MEGRVDKTNEFHHKRNVLYLMQREHRVENNHSMILSQNLSYETETQLFIGTILGAIKRNKVQENFMFEGLTELNKLFLQKNLQYFIISNVERFIKDMDIDCIVTDFSPLTEVINHQNQLKKICEERKIAFYICDSHNIVPCKKLDTYVKTPKAVRSRVYKLWDKYFFKDFEIVDVHKFNKIEKGNFEKNKNDYCLYENYKVPLNKNYTKFKGGYTSGIKELNNFFHNKMPFYKKLRNDANVDFLSNLSPWVHFGQLSTAEILKEAFKRFDKNDENLQCFVSEIFVWKEIAEHFCYHEKNYDNINGALPWAKQTLNQHKNDKREKFYTIEELEKGLTYDEQWNAGQKEMVITGKMHGYVRMYWAKKIIYWVESPEKAIEYAIFLNDKYSIDGNDPNGYLGVMWSICGAMDQGWGERDVVGKVRSMKGIKAKDYVRKWSSRKI